MNLTIADFREALGQELRGYTEPTFNCPYCKLRLDVKTLSEKGVGSIHVNIEKNVAICHRCDFKTRNIHIIIYNASGKLPKKLINMSKGALDTVMDILKKESIKKNKQITLPKTYKPLTLPPRGKLAKECCSYIQQRNIKQGVLDSVQVGYARTGRFSNMLIFPIYIGNILSYYTSRSIKQLAFIKTINAKAPKNGVIFNYNNAVKTDTVIVCEGVFDALSCSFKGTQGVGVLGHFLSDAQARLLAELDVKKFVVCFDADSHKHTLEAAYKLSKFVEQPVYYILMDKGDPNSEIKQLPKYLKSIKKISLEALISYKFFT